MVVFSVLSPAIFDESYFEHPGYQDQLALYFRSLQSNGVMLIDQDGHLLKEFEEVSSALPIKYRQDLEIRLGELRTNMRQKGQRRCIVKCQCKIEQSQSFGNQCIRVATDTCPDAVFLSQKDQEESGTRGVRMPVQDMRRYLYTDVEGSRHRYMESLPPLDCMKDGEFDELMRRATKYSRWLRFFDPQIGKGGKNLSNFRRSIHRVLTVWSESAHFRGQLDFGEIITVEPELIAESDNDHARNKKQQRNRQVIERIQDDVVAPLMRDFASVAIRLYVKSDPTKMFHARHLQTQTATVMFERGFDFLDDNGSFRRGFIRNDNAAHLDSGNGGSHLDSLRRLKESPQMLDFRRVL